MNSIPKKDSIKFIENITTSDLPIQLIIITGKNAALKKEISKVKYKIKVVTLGWTNKVWQYMKAVDFVITKAGGATVAESIAAQKPIIINQVIMGQEEGNLELIKNHHLGKLIHDDPTEKINPTIKFILKHLQSYNKNLKKHSKPDASLKIAQFIDSQLS